MLGLTVFGVFHTAIGVIALIYGAGVRAFDIRNPFNPVEIAFYIPATTPKTDQRCVTIKGVESCKVAIQTNNVDVDRANTGMHILELTGDAREIANFPQPSRRGARREEALPAIIDFLG